MLTIKIFFFKWWGGADNMIFNPLNKSNIIKMSFINKFLVSEQSYLLPHLGKTKPNY